MHLNSVTAFAYYFSSTLNAKWTNVYCSGTLFTVINRDSAGKAIANYDIAASRYEDSYLFTGDPIGAGFIDTKGNVVVHLIYDYERFTMYEFYFYDGLAKMCLDGKYGFVNTSGEEIAASTYSFTTNI